MPNSLNKKDIISDHEKLQSLNAKQNKLEIEYLDLIEKQEGLEKFL